MALVGRTDFSPLEELSFVERHECHGGKDSVVDVVCFFVSFFGGRCFISHWPGKFYRVSKLLSFSGGGGGGGVRFFLPCDFA